MGVQPGVLHGNQMGRGARFVVMGMPLTRWRNEGPAGLPVHPDRVDHVAAVVEAVAKQAVAAGLAIQDQVECHRLVAVRALDLSFGQQPEHRPARG